MLHMAVPSHRLWVVAIAIVAYHAAAALAQKQILLKFDRNQYR